MEHPCSCCCRCYCSLALIHCLCLFVGPHLSPPVVLPLLVYPCPVVLVDPHQPPFVLAIICLLAPIVFAPAHLPPLGCAGSSLLAAVHADPHLSPPVVFAPTHLTSSCSQLCSFELVCARSGLFVLVQLLFALICTCPASHLCLYQIYD